MPHVGTPCGALHYEIVDLVAPWIPTGSPADRPTILFHHGIGGCAGMWSGWLPHLIDRYRVVTWDMRGYGRSAISGFDWSLDLLVADVFAVADAVGAGRFHLVGESIGGTVALAAAIAKPDRLSTLTVSNGAHLGASIQRVEAWRRQLDEGGSKAWSDAFMRDRFYDRSLSSERRTWFAEQQAKWPRDSILNALGVLVGTDLSDRLAAIRCPTLLLHPDASPFIPVPVMAELHRLLPGSQLHVVGHSRHGLPFSHDVLCAARLRSFLDSMGAPHAPAGGDG